MQIEAVEITLPSKGPWKVLVDGKQAGSKTLYVVHDNKIKVPALSSLVLKQRNRLNNAKSGVKGVFTSLLKLK